MGQIFGGQGRARLPALARCNNPRPKRPSLFAAAKTLSVPDTMREFFNQCFLVGVWYRMPKDEQIKSAEFAMIQALFEAKCRDDAITCRF